MFIVILFNYTSC